MHTKEIKGFTGLQVEVETVEGEVVRGFLLSVSPVNVWVITDDDKDTLVSLGSIQHIDQASVKETWTDAQVAPMYRAFSQMVAS